MKKSILRERRERYYEELRKIGLMDEPKEDNTAVELENDNKNEESTIEIEDIDSMFKDGNPEYIEETNEETVENEDVIEPIEETEIEDGTIEEIELKEDNIVEKENKDEQVVEETINEEQNNEETNENETIQEEKPLKSSKKVAKTGKKKVVND